MAEARRDQNSVTTLLAVSNADDSTVVRLWADPTTHRLLVDTSNVSFAGLSDVSLTTPAQGDLLYFDGTDWVNLDVGTNGQFLKTQGAGANPVWATLAGGGDVSKVGTPVNNQVGVWTGDGTIEGDTALTFDTSTDLLTSGALAIAGTAGAGFITLVAQASNPTAPAAGTLLLHSSTTQGFTRMEQDNEAKTNIVLGRDNVIIAKIPLVEL